MPALKSFFDLFPKCFYRVSKTQPAELIQHRFSVPVDGQRSLETVEKSVPQALVYLLDFSGKEEIQK